jgi:hypothetical protein
MGLLDDAIREHLDLKRRRGADPTEIERAEREALGPVRREPSMSAALAGESATSGTRDAPPEDFAFVSDPEDFGADAPTTVSAPGAVDDLEDEARAGIAAPHYADPDFDEFAAIEPPPASTVPELEPAAPVELEPDPVFEPLEEPEPKPKRRHLFGRHRHDDEIERPPLPVELPDDDPFAPELAPEDDPFADESPVTGAIESDAGESVGRAQPIQRDEPPAAPQSPPTLRITPEGEPGNTIEYDVEEAFREEDGAPTPEDEDILEETPDFLADTPDHDRLWFEQKPPPDFDFDN